MSAKPQHSFNLVDPSGTIPGPRPQPYGISGLLRALLHIFADVEATSVPSLGARLLRHGAHYSHDPSSLDFLFLEAWRSRISIASPLRLLFFWQLVDDENFSALFLLFASRIDVSFCPFGFLHLHARSSVPLNPDLTFHTVREQRERGNASLGIGWLHWGTGHQKLNIDICLSYASTSGLRCGLRFKIGKIINCRKKQTYCSARFNLYCTVAATSRRIKQITKRPRPALLSRVGIPPSP